MLITTAKDPDALCRRIARAIYLATPGSRLEFRGKRTLAALVSKARKKRFERVCAIYHAQGKPSEIRFLEIGMRDWRWMAPHLAITKVLHAPAMKGGISQSFGLQIRGTEAKTLQKLLSIKGKPEEAQSSISSSASKISFKLGNKKLLELGVRYGK